MGPMELCNLEESINNVFSLTEERDKRIKELEGLLTKEQWHILEERNYYDRYNSPNINRKQKYQS